MCETQHMLHTWALGWHASPDMPTQCTPPKSPPSYMHVHLCAKAALTMSAAMAYAWQTSKKQLHL